MIDKSKLPRHIAIIMDGNGRWAKERGFPRIMGHRAGIKAVREITEACAKMDIQVLTLYAFSVENWRRPRHEVDTLMDFLDKFLKKELKTLNKNNIRLTAIGRLDGLPGFVQEQLKSTIEKTKSNKGLILNLALNYGGRSEIVDATKRIVRELEDGNLKLKDLNEETFSKFLYTVNLPDPDLLIRTSGELRISNFLLYQISYTEIYVSPKYWPDFHKEDLEQAIEEFEKRERRFGGIKPKC